MRDRRLGAPCCGVMAAIVSTVFALQPLLSAGFPTTADGALHLHRTLELTRQWQGGIFYSRWAADLVYGLGYPLWNFYAPLFYYLAGALRLMGLDLDLAVKLVLAGIFLIGASGMYIFAREWLGPLPALLASIAYTYAPFRLREAYFQGDYAQFLGLSLLPAILWAAHRLLATGRTSFVLILSVSYAALMLSHNVTAMLFSPLLLAFGLFVTLVQRLPWRHLVRFASSLILALAATMFFWLPALHDRQYVQWELLQQGHFSFHGHFLGLADLISATWPLDAARVNPPDPLHFGLLILVLALASLASLGRKTMLRWPIAFMVAVFILLLFLMLQPSTPVWELLPLITFTQFPWRLLGLAALPLAFLAGTAAFFASSGCLRRCGHGRYRGVLGSSPVPTRALP